MNLNLLRGGLRALGPRTSMMEQRTWTRLGSRARSQCAFEGCTKTANFGMPGGRATHCATHKEDGMVDVKNPRCAFDDLARETAGRISFTHGRSVDKAGRVIGKTERGA